MAQATVRRGKHPMTDVVRRIRGLEED